jgi:hypothetical protein
VLSAYLYSPCTRSSASASRISFCSRAIFGSSGVPSYTSHRTCRASSLRPFAYRYLGDSGTPKTMITTTCFLSVSPTRTRREDTHDCKDDLASNWQSPSDRSAYVGDAIVEEVGNNNTNADEKRLRTDNATTLVCFDQFALIHRDSASLDTSSDSSNVASNQDLGHRIRCRLENSTNDLSQSV